MKRQFGRNNHIEAALVREAQRLAAPLIAAEDAKRRQNACAFAQAQQTTPSEKARTAAIARAAEFGAVVERNTQDAIPQPPREIEEFDCRPADSETAETNTDVETIDVR
jgi:hypothetical protein